MSNTSATRPLPEGFDVFCRVVDNYGDAAVCWRLACSLAALPARVRLWIDDPAVLAALSPEANSVEVLPWRDETDFGEPAPVAIDAFGAGLPERHVEALAARRGLWIVLEYLSAESWVADRHGLPSPHPRLPVRRYFYFPGFGPGTGGLLREAGLAERRRRFLAGHVHPQASVVTLFGYENPALATLLDAWAGGSRPVIAIVPKSRLSADVTHWLGQGLGDEAVVRRGALELRGSPFVPQARYDELLWSADWNFVRGEDSFVRAQWAERPFAWQIYPQAEGAHLVKLEAFLARYVEGLPAPLAAALRTLWMAWNGAGPADALPAAWDTLVADLPTLHRHAADWAAGLGTREDLAMGLARFCAERLE